jgi:hypothetical protein
MVADLPMMTGQWWSAICLEFGLAEPLTLKMENDHAHWRC